MIRGNRVILRPVQDSDWSLFEAWGQSRDALWGDFQRFQLDHVPLLRQAFQATGFLKRDSGVFLIETIVDGKAIGFVRYTLIPLPDADLPQPEIGFGIAEASARGQGYAKEALRLLVEYLFAGYPVQRITGFTDVQNIPAQKAMEAAGFKREGVLRRAMYRDGDWQDIAIYGRLKAE